MLKICTKCGIEKPATTEFFHKSRGGLRSACKDCLAKWRKENKEYISEVNKQYREENKEKIKEYKKVYQKEQYPKIRAYRVANAEKIKIQQKEYSVKYREENKEYLLEQKKIYYRENKEILREKQIVYVQNNKEKIQKYKNKWTRFKTKTDPNFRLTMALRSRLTGILRRIQKFVLQTTSEIIKIEKCDSTFNLVGCDLEFLKNHLEKQFDENMNWANYGPYWHVDHIRPCASFDLTDPEQQRICFHYTNLQPLEAKENMRKGAKWSS